MVRQEYYSIKSSNDSVIESLFKHKERFMCIKSSSMEHPYDDSWNVTQEGR